MIRRPRASTRTDTHLPHTTRFRSVHGCDRCHPLGRAGAARSAPRTPGGPTPATRTLPMSLLPILELPHPRLRNVAGALDTDRIATAQFQRLLDAMPDTIDQQRVV